MEEEEGRRRGWSVCRRVRISLEPRMRDFEL